MAEWLKDYSVEIAVAATLFVVSRVKALRRAAWDFYIQQPRMTLLVLAVSNIVFGFYLGFSWNGYMVNRDPAENQVAVNDVAPELPNSNNGDGKNEIASDAKEHTVLKPPAKLDTKLTPNKKHSDNPLSEFIDLGNGWLKCKTCELIGKFLDYGEGPQFYERAPIPPQK